MLHTQEIELHLDGITAGDYLTYYVDSDPAVQAPRLRAVSLDADPVGNLVTASLRWDGPPPAAKVAAVAAGLHLTADVARLSARVSVPLPRRARRLVPAPRSVALAV